MYRGSTLEDDLQISPARPPTHDETGFPGAQRTTDTHATTSVLTRLADGAI